MQFHLCTSQPNWEVDGFAAERQDGQAAKPPVPALFDFDFGLLFVCN